jgi:hypothetical protein
LRRGGEGRKEEGREEGRGKANMLPDKRKTKWRRKGDGRKRRKETGKSVGEQEGSTQSCRGTTPPFVSSSHLDDMPLVVVFVTDQDHRELLALLLLRLEPLLGLLLVFGGAHAGGGL